MVAAGDAADAACSSHQEEAVNITFKQVKKVILPFCPIKEDPRFLFGMTLMTLFSNVSVAYPYSVIGVVVFI